MISEVAPVIELAMEDRWDEVVELLPFDLAAYTGMTRIDRPLASTSC